MSIFSSCRAFHIFLAFLYIFWTVHVDASYKIKLQSIKKCSLPELRMDRSGALQYWVSARKVDRGTTLLRTNFTLARRTGPISITFRCYQQQQNSVKDLVFQLERLSCSSALAAPLVRAINVSLTPDCYALPGSYSADRINIEDFKWILTKAMVGAGKYAYDLEFLTERGVVACIDISCDISAVK